MSKILFLGDFFYDYDSKEEDIKEIINYIKKENYQVILNLEGSLSKFGKKIRKRGPNLVNSSETIKILKELNVIGVTLSNNHMLDYSYESLCETIKILDENNIKHCGAGKNLEESLKPMIFVYKDKKIIINNYGWNLEETIYAKVNEPGCSPLNEKIMNGNIQKSNCNYNINIMHWGFEYNLYPLPKDVKIAHELLNNGIDLIIGHHPHCIQTMENYNQKNIYYSLGNFYFGSRRSTFDHIKFKAEISDRCSYGLGVLFDVEKLKIEKEIIFYYKNDNTNIISDDKIINVVLDRINNIQLNDNYYNLVKKYNENITPILTGSKIEDGFKIFILRILYVYVKIKIISNYIPGVKRFKNFLKTKIKRVG